MALDPFATVDQAAQLAKLSINPDPKRVFHCMYRTHLVGYGTDATDACRNVWSLAIHAPTQECLEETRWLDDLQFHIRDSIVLDLHIECSLAFDASQVIHLDGLIVHAFHSPCGTPRHKH